MNTALLTTTQHDIAHAAQILKGGGLVAFPTETVYGLGANGLDGTAVKKIFAAKGRPGDNPLILHIYNTAQLHDIVSKIPDNAKKLMDAFWPGPLTIVFPKSDLVPLEVTAGLDTVAVRMPKSKTALQLLENVALPIAAPSANSSGRPSPTTAQHVLTDMDGKIDAVIDGGACDVGVESTVVDVTGDVPLLLRPGGITYEQLVQLLGNVQKNYEYKDGEIPRSPGVKYKHYAPDAEAYVVRGSLCGYAASVSGNYCKIGVLTYSGGAFPSNCVVKQFAKEEYAQKLFSSLRDFNDAKVDIILAEDIDESGINLAVHNRLYKAAGYKVVKA